MRAIGLALALLTVGAAGVAPARAATGFDTDLEAALESGRPVFAFFTAEWCEPCQQMKAEVFTDPQVVDALAHYARVEVDVETPAGKAAWERHRVAMLPTALILRRGYDPQAVGRLEGARTASELVAYLRPEREQRPMNLEATGNTVLDCTPGYPPHEAASAVPLALAATSGLLLLGALALWWRRKRRATVS